MKPLRDSFETAIHQMPLYGEHQQLDRLRIRHTEGTFHLPSHPDSAPSKINTVILGLIHQRVMFSEDRQGVPCKSPNGQIGIPGENFPWEHSSFDPTQYLPTVGQFRELPCGQCRFKEFGSSLNPSSQAPACSEQYTMPLFYNSPTDSEQWNLAVFSVQKTGLEPTRKFLTSFQIGQKPAYTAVTTIQLHRIAKNNLQWSIPSYTVLSSTSSASHRRASQFLHELRTAITAPPVITEKGKVIHSQVKYKHRDDFSDLIA